MNANGPQARAAAMSAAAAGSLAACDEHLRKREARHPEIVPCSFD